MFLFYSMNFYLTSTWRGSTLLDVYKFSLQESGWSSHLSTSIAEFRYSPRRPEMHDALL